MFCFNYIFFWHVTRIKKSLPEDVRETPAASFTTALLSATLATSMCYPLDTVRRQLQMKGTPFLNVADALPGKEPFA